jgi:transcriptional regulator with XRE-family HTH domain
MENRGLAERLQHVLGETGLSQKQFAGSINVSESYVSQVLRNGCGMSKATALLIEKTYGFSQNWLLNGHGPARGEEAPVPGPLKERLIRDIDKMNLPELKAVYAYIKTLQDVK